MHADEKDAATEINTDAINTSSEDIILVERLSTPTSNSEDNPERQRCFGDHAPKTI